MSTEPGGLQETAAVLRDVDEVRGLEEDRIGGLYIGIGGGGGGGGSLPGSTNNETSCLTGLLQMLY